MRSAFGLPLLCAGALIAVSSFPASAALVGLSSSTPGTLFSIDTATGNTTPIVNLSGTNFTSIVGLEYLNGLLYATDVQDGVNFTFGSIDLNTGVYTPINLQGGSANWYSLAADPVANLLYSVDADNGNTLVSVTPGGVITNIGPVGSVIAGLAYDAVNHILYGIGSGQLFTINVTTGTATLLGDTTIPFSNDAGLAYDPATATLYMNTAAGTLYSLNTTSGVASFIGSNSVTLIDGLAVIPDVPEPSSIALVALGAVAMALKLRRR
jgi:hypothetical protein